jgi:hypothetical protein
MRSYSDRDTYSQAGDWLLGAMRRNPEALLLMAAGCCLMMRSGSASSRMGARASQYMRDDWDYQTGRPSSQMRYFGKAREGLARASESATDTAESAAAYASQMKDRVADTARDYASQMKDRISDTASAYADSIADFAGDARWHVVERSARLKQQTQATLQSSLQRVLREQPLAVAVAGLAAGAAVAAIFPRTEVEDRVLGGAREKLKETGEQMMDAAGKAGERLKSAAEERGLTSEGLKEVAGEVADTFKNAMSDNSEGSGASSGSPGSPGGMSGSGQNFGMDKSTGRAPHSTSAGTGDGRSMR